MKTLSIQQPWASMICAGIKDVENRTWKAAKLPGRILIHASSKKITRNFFSYIPEEWESYICNHVFYGNLQHLDELPTSAIVGYVTVDEFIEGKFDSVWDGGEDQIKWKLKDAWMFDEPILGVKGKLNLFEYELDENNLPPAHKVMLKQMAIHGDELVVPTTDAHIERILREKIEVVEIYVLDDNMQILLKNTDNGLVYEPQKTVSFEGETKKLKFELGKDTDIYSVPDSETEKPINIMYHDGSYGIWQVLQIVLGKQLGLENIL